MRIICSNLIAAALLAATGCAAAPPAPPTAQEQMATAVREALPEDLLKGLVTDADVASLFAMFRAALKGQDAEMPKGLDQKMEKLAEELPARMEPLLDKLLTIAEKEVLKNMQQQPKPGQ